MLVLGIHDGHDASACLLRDGRVVLASAEERRRNEKNFAGVPTRSVDEILGRSGVKPGEIDVVRRHGRMRPRRVDALPPACPKSAHRAHPTTTRGVSACSGFPLVVRSDS